MQNLEQIRASHALRETQNPSLKITKQAASKLPTMIMTNGLLAACAFANENGKDAREKKRPDMKAAMDATAKHLAKLPHTIGRIATARNTPTPATFETADLVRALTAENATSLDLQRATTEALKFLSYLKRYVTKVE